jgi:tRNA(fMet)-specific endonuclease VapC
VTAGYLLDTNACIALINGKPEFVRKRFERALTNNATVLLSSIVVFELWYGVAKSRHKDLDARRVETFCSGPLEWTPFDDEDAREAGTVRAELEARGKPIGAYDVLLAGQARRRGATVITSNAREYDRVAGLQWEDWAAARVRKR